MKAALPTARFVLAALCLLGAVACSPSGEENAGFYQGKTVRIIVAYGPGGGVDLFARSVARYLPNHIPGHPTVIVENMPGAAGLIATNYVYDHAPQDGTVIAATALAPLLMPLLDPKMAKVDPRKFHWLPSQGGGLSVVFAINRAPVNSAEDMRQTPLKVGASSAIGQAAFFGRVMTETLGVKFKYVLGYNDGGLEELLAMERGELDGHSGLMWSSLKTLRPDWIRDKQIKVLLQYGGKRAADLPDVPMARDLIASDADKELFDVATAPVEILRPFFLGPDVPPERVALIRKAFSDMYADPGFFDEALKQNIFLEKVTGEEIEALLDKMYNAPTQVVARIRKIYAAPAQ